jgi:regulator of nucleoside diphosphate kinase
MVDTEADALAEIAMSNQARHPVTAALLLAEIDRATLHRADTIPADVVTMGAIVEFVDEARGTSRTVQLVYPREADTAQGRISILTPLGAGLIGMRTGQSILWPDRKGSERSLNIVKVLQAQPQDAKLAEPVGND